MVQALSIYFDCIFDFVIRVIQQFKSSIRFTLQSQGFSPLLEFLADKKGTEQKY
jgi:hypothetical protein